MSNWYGDEITIEEARMATNSLRENKSTLKTMYFDAKRGQVLVCLQDQALIRAGGVCLSLKDTPDYSLFVHKDQQYTGYRANKKFFEPANDQQINDFFGVTAKLRDESLDELSKLGQELEADETDINYKLNGVEIAEPDEEIEIENTSEEEELEPIEEYDEDIENNTD